MADLKRYFGNLRDALLGRDEFSDLSGGIPFKVGPGSEGAWPRARMEYHWHPPLAAAREVEPIEPVGRFRSWMQRHRFWRKSA